MIEKLRGEIAEIAAERDRVVERINTIRVLHHAAVAERNEAQERAVRERRLRVALEKYVKRAERNV